MTIGPGDTHNTYKGRKHYRMNFKKGHTMVRIWIPNHYWERISKAKELQGLSWWKCVLLGLGLRELRDGALFPANPENRVSQEP